MLRCTHFYNRIVMNRTFLLTNTKISFTQFRPYSIRHNPNNPSIHANANNLSIHDDEIIHDNTIQPCIHQNTSISSNSISSKASNPPVTPFDCNTLPLADATIDRFKLPNIIQDALKKAGITSFSPIQQLLLNHLQKKSMKGHSGMDSSMHQTDPWFNIRTRLLLLAETGSGKTLAYLLPFILSKLSTRTIDPTIDDVDRSINGVDKPIDSTIDSTIDAANNDELQYKSHPKEAPFFPSGLIILPNDTLAMQVYLMARRLFSGIGLVPRLWLGSSQEDDPEVYRMFSLLSILHTNQRKQSAILKVSTSSSSNNSTTDSKSLNGINNNTTGTNGPSHPSSTANGNCLPRDEFSGQVILNAQTFPRQHLLITTASRLLSFYDPKMSNRNKNIKAGNKGKGKNDSHNDGHVSALYKKNLRNHNRLVLSQLMVRLDYLVMDEADTMLTGKNGSPAYKDFVDMMTWLLQARGNIYERIRFASFKEAMNKGVTEGVKESVDQGVNGKSEQDELIKQVIQSVNGMDAGTLDEGDDPLNEDDDTVNESDLSDSVSQPSIHVSPLSGSVNKDESNRSSASKYLNVICAAATFKGIITANSNRILSNIPQLLIFRMFPGIKVLATKNAQLSVASVQQQFVIVDAPLANKKAEASRDGVSTNGSRDGVSTNGSIPSESKVGNIPSASGEAKSLKEMVIANESVKTALFQEKLTKLKEILMAEAVSLKSQKDDSSVHHHLGPKRIIVFCEQNITIERIFAHFDQKWLAYLDSKEQETESDLSNGTASIGTESIGTSNVPASSSSASKESLVIDASKVFHVITGRTDIDTRLRSLSIFTTPKAVHKKGKDYETSGMVIDDGCLQVMLATDMMSRGVDMVDVDLVIHFDAASDETVFLHRSGRTGRLNSIYGSRDGTVGRVISLVAPDQLDQAMKYHELCKA